MTVSLNSNYNAADLAESGDMGTDASRIFADDRSIEIQGNHPHPSLADTVFISGPLGFCIEVSKRDFIEAVKQEFGLIEIPSDLRDMAEIAL